jgi:hypothetical protein
MMHLPPYLLFAVAFDSQPLESDAEQHLAVCDACRQDLKDLRALAQELSVMRASQPSAAALDRYYAAQAHIQQQPSRLATVWRSITAILAWDSRQQPALQGVRSGAGSAAYRLLYATEQAEVELLIEPEGRAFRTQGEIIANGELQAADTPLTPALIQWIDPKGDVRYETESDASGLFSLRNIAPGTYRLSIVSAASDIIEIEALEIM